MENKLDFYLDKDDLGYYKISRPLNKLLGMGYCYKKFSEPDLYALILDRERYLNSQLFQLKSDLVSDKKADWELRDLYRRIYDIQSDINDLRWYLRLFF